MYREEIRLELRELITQYLSNKGLDLVDVVLRYEGRDLFLRILTDRPEGGITLEECSAINSELGQMIEEKDILSGRYILEVSSPGLDRPLKTRADFFRCLKRRIRVFFNEEYEGKMEDEGWVVAVSDEMLTMETGTGIKEIPLIKIRIGKQVIDL
jgi:ribosome maturation factor RimP